MSQSASQTMTISRLAKAAGVKVETVRFYQRSGLLDEPPRPASGYRQYATADVQRIRFIKRAQVLGFTLEEIAGLLRLEGARTCAETRELAARKLGMVESRLTDLTAMRAALLDMIGKCDTGDRQGECPMIRALVED